MTNAVIQLPIAFLMACLLKKFLCSFYFHLRKKKKNPNKKPCSNFLHSKKGGSVFFNSFKN